MVKPFNMIHVPISYNRIFERDEHQNNEDLISEIPSRIMLTFYSYINYHLHIGKSDFEIYEFISRNWDSGMRVELWLAAKVAAEKNESQLIIFSQWVVTECIKYELANFRNFEFKRNDTTPEDEFNIFIFYLKRIDVIIDEQNEKKEVLEKKISFSFQEMTWPFFIKQYEFRTALLHESAGQNIPQE